jgi:hypothetical protein
LPGADVRSAVAERLPFLTTFDLALAQLVVHFIADPVSGCRRWPGHLSRRPGRRLRVGSRRGSGPLATFWRAVHDIDPHVRDESELAGAREGHLAELCEAARLKDIEPMSLTVTVRLATFDDWWEPFTLGVGPAGAYVARLDEAQRDALRSRCVRLLPPSPFEIAASAWCVRARA